MPAVSKELDVYKRQEYGLEGDNVIVVRPSGTEPKIKVYFMVKGQSRAEAEDLEAQLKVQMTRLMGF